MLNTKLYEAHHIIISPGTGNNQIELGMVINKKSLQEPVNFSHKK